MSSSLAQDIARLLLAPTLMFALAILVKGYADTGDGFAAGVVAGLGVLLQYVVLGAPEAEARLGWVRYAARMALIGLAIVLAVATWPLLRGEALLTHLPAPGAPVIHVGSLELITAVAFDVGVFLLVFGVVIATLRSIAGARA